MKKDDEKMYLIPELNVKISEPWVNLISWCQTTCPHGTIELKIVNGLPTDLISWKPKIMFDKPSSIPSEPPLKLK